LVAAGVYREERMQAKGGCRRKEGREGGREGEGSEVEKEE